MSSNSPAREQSTEGSIRLNSTKSADTATYIFHKQPECRAMLEHVLGLAFDTPKAGEITYRGTPSQQDLVGRVWTALVTNNDKLSPDIIKAIVMDAKKDNVLALRFGPVADQGKEKAPKPARSRGGKKPVNTAVESLIAQFMQCVLGNNVQRAPYAPKGTKQVKYVDAIRTHRVTFGIGPPGVGKSMNALAVAVDMLRKGEVDQILLATAAIEAGGQKIGTLPGGVEDKVSPFAGACFDALNDLVGPEGVIHMITHGQLKMVPIAHALGRNHRRAFVLVDDAQNISAQAFELMLTRQTGDEGKAVFTGDYGQIHMLNPAQSGLKEWCSIAPYMGDAAAVVEFTRDDIIFGRGSFVQKVLAAKEQYKEALKNGIIKDELIQGLTSGDPAAIPLGPNPRLSPRGGR